MRCPQCGHENAVEMKFCGECGARLAFADLKSSMELLARISHTNKCIGAPNQRKLLCSNDFLAIRKRPDDDKL